MGCSVRCALALSFLVLAPALVAQPAPRRPRGIYAVVNVEQTVNQQQKANPSITPAQLNAYFDSLYQALLDDAAVSGLTLQVHWDTLNPNPPASPNAYDWSYVDDAFAQAAAWDVQNPAQPPKTIQLIVSAGFQTPQWVLDQIPSCDGLFQSPVQTPPGTCGKATFEGFTEGGDGTVLPLPWNSIYKNSWQTFLTALAARYGSNPAFVSIAVAGPTAASAEMILPNDGNSDNPQTQFAANIAPNDMWRQLLVFQYPGMAAYHNTDQAFIDEWNAAIDMYGQVFSGVTLVATTGDGLPDLSSNYTIPPAFSGDCGNPDMDCAAETTILSHFVQPGVGGANAKATQTSGMEASRADNANLGVASVKLLSQRTAQLPSPATQILGGSQFNTSFSNFTLQEGCTSTFPPNANDMPPGCSIPPTCTIQACIPGACIPQACLAPGVTQANVASYAKLSQIPASDLIPPEQAEYNVLNVYFNGTAAASSFGGTQGAAPLNYLQIYSPDIQYAVANVNAPAQVVETGGATVSMTAQALLNLASQKLLEMAEPTLPSPASAGPAAGSGSAGAFTFTFSDSAGFQSLTVVDVLINNALDGRQACYVAFVPSGANSGSVYLVDNGGDAGGPYSGMTLPGSQTVSNGQCTITGTGSSVSSSGNSVTLTLAITFASGFAGNKLFYLSAQDASGNSGWQVLGTWNVPGAQAAGPSVSGMSPARSNTSSQTYTFTFTDTIGWQDIAVANVLINSAIDGRHGCYLAFLPASSSLLLVDDAGDAAGPYSGMVLPGVGSNGNSQCTVAGAGSTVSGSGNTLTLALAITFSQSFAGNQVFFLAARNGVGSGQNSGWQAVGTNTVP